MVLNCKNRNAAAKAITIHPTSMMIFEFQCVRTARDENSTLGSNILCSLFGDQKVAKVASPDLTDLTRPEYHHSSAKGTFTPAIAIKARGRSAVAPHAIAVPIFRYRNRWSLSTPISLPWCAEI